MTLLLMVSVLATVLNIQGDILELNKGMIDGLRGGDRGQIFYTLTVGSRKVKIAGGMVEIFECSDFSCRAREAGPRTAQAGYSIEFQIDEDRQSSETLLFLASERVQQGEFTKALRYFEEIKRLVPDDPSIEEQIRDIESSLSSQVLHSGESEALEIYRIAARDYFEEGNQRIARFFIDRIREATPDDATALELLAAMKENKRGGGAVFQITSGDYQVGHTHKEASYYNQEPRFRVHLESLWMSVNPVTGQEFRHVRGSGLELAGAESRPVTSITFEEAQSFCRSSGGRLPTEFEWEIAAADARFRVTDGVSEWTGSWYKPYPGNSNPEAEYGEKFKVIRGFDQRGRFDPSLRFFMLPGERASDVGFRCAYDTAQDAFQVP